MSYETIVARGDSISPTVDNLNASTPDLTAVNNEVASRLNESDSDLASQADRVTDLEDTKIAVNAQITTTHTELQTPGNKAVEVDQECQKLKDFAGKYPNLRMPLTDGAFCQSAGKYYKLLSAEHVDLQIEPSQSPHWEEATYGVRPVGLVGDVVFKPEGFTDPAFLKCDGNIYLQSAHPDLYAVVGDGGLTGEVEERPTFTEGGVFNIHAYNFSDDGMYLANCRSSDGLSLAYRNSKGEYGLVANTTSYISNYSVDVFFSNNRVVVFNQGESAPFRVFSLPTLTYLGGSTSGYSSSYYVDQCLTDPTKFAMCSNTENTVKVVRTTSGSTFSTLSTIPATTASNGNPHTPRSVCFIDETTLAVYYYHATEKKYRVYSVASSTAVLLYEEDVDSTLASYLGTRFHNGAKLPRATKTVCYSTSTRNIAVLTSTSSGVLIEQETPVSSINPNLLGDNTDRCDLYGSFKGGADCYLHTYIHGGAASADRAYVARLNKSGQLEFTQLDNNDPYISAVNPVFKEALSSASRRTTVGPRHNLHTEFMLPNIAPIEVQEPGNLYSTIKYHAYIRRETNYGE